MTALRQGMLAAVLAVAMAAAGGSAKADAPGEDPPKVIAVRVDARPFAWRTEDSVATFRGYLVDLCIDATTRAGFHFELVPVTAADRELILSGDFLVQSGALAGERIDLLCDPTTITLDRLAALLRAEQYDATFSPIVFVANGSSVKRVARDDQAPCELGPQSSAHPACATVPLAHEGGDQGESGGAAATVEVVEPEGARCWPEAGDAYFMAAGVTGTTAQATVERAVRMNLLGLREGQRVCWKAVANHRDGVEAFCKKEYQFYFGDLDIINAYRTLAVEAGIPCDVVPGRPLSYEPYALLITSEDAAYRSALIAAIYEIFADGTAAGASTPISAATPSRRRSRCSTGSTGSPV
jgi:ABC-type amino acid transport substrate-binding protein